MSRRVSDSDANRTRPFAPSALLLGPAEQYGSTEPWFMGVVLQQACQAMTRRG